MSRAQIDDPIDVRDAELRALLQNFGVGKVAAKSVLASIVDRDDLLRGWRTALARAVQRGLDATMLTWIQTQLHRLAAEEATGEMRALAAEIEAALRLSWVGAVVRLDVGPDPTCDFRIGALNVEVYCPQEHVQEGRVVKAEIAERLKKAPGPVKIAVAISHPTTGSGRKVNDDGQVIRDPESQALSFPANKLIDRILSEKKRRGTQFPVGEPNILWLDLKQGLGLTAASCLPLRSNVAKGTCFVGMNAVWHAFYGRAGDPLFVERTVLEYRLRPGTYPQQREGWFRELPRASCAILSVLDGVIRLDNPWAAVPLGAEVSAQLMLLSDFRPEFSWFDEQAPTLEMRVEAERQRIAWVARQGA